MYTLNTILVAVDFSTGSRAALEQGARIARLQGATLHVLHVVDSAAVSTLAASRESSFENQAKAATEGAHTALNTWLSQSEVHANADISIAIGTPLHEILSHVRSLKADLLVAGIAGTGQSVSGAGSVSGKLARKSPCRVLLVRSNHTHAFRKVVACLDFSDTAREVMASARRIAIKDSASVDFLHVWQEPWVVAAPRSGFADTVYPSVALTTAERLAHIASLRRELHDFVSEASQGIHATEVLQESTNGCNGIVAHAGEAKADLIIVGSKGRTSLRYVLMGSTAERLLTRLPCSVLVVKPSPSSAG